MLLRYARQIVVKAAKRVNFVSVCVCQYWTDAFEVASCLSSDIGLGGRSSVNRFYSELHMGGHIFVGAHVCDRGCKLE